MRMTATMRKILTLKPAFASILTADDDDGECAGDDGRTRVRVLRSGIGARAKVGGDEIDAVGGEIVGHGARAGLGGEAFNCGIAGGGGVNDGENAVAAGNKCK